MIEYHADFRKVTNGDEADVVARVSENDPQLVEAIEAIRSQLVERATQAGIDLGVIPNGHFMELEFIVRDGFIQGVAFTTPYLPGKFKGIIQTVLAEAGVEHVF